MITEKLQLRGFRRLLAAVCLGVLSLAASEHHGVVKFGELPLPGAMVTATQGDKSFTAVTDGAGAYKFPDLPDGVWTLKIEMLCFAPLTKEVAVSPDAPSPVWEMKLLALDEMNATAAASVPKPAAAAPGAAQTASNTATAAAANAPAANGKKPAKGKAAATPQQTGQFQRTDVNASAGAGAAASAPAETIAPADANGASEAMVVNGSVSNGIERRAIGNARKGPGSLFRGDLVGIMDNSALDARQYSLTGQDTPRAAYNHLRFGGSFGGPLIIPHLLHGNGQFFINYMLGRNRSANNASILVPTDAQRNGDFSGLVDNQGKPIQLVDPRTQIPIPNNQIPKSQFSSQAIALLKFYPQANFVQTAGYNYQVALISPSDSDDVNSRINKTISRKDFLNGGVAYHNGRGSNPNVFGFTDSNDSVGINANVNWRHMFNQRVNSSFGLSFSHYSNSNSPFFANRPDGNISQQAGITGNDQSPANYGPPSISFSGSGIQPLYDGNESRTKNQTIGFSYTGLWVKRPHNFTYGGDIRRQQFNNLSQQNPRGSIGFTGGLVGNDFASFLLGIPDTASIAFSPLGADKYFRSGMYDAYINDDWRVAAGLTVNIGLRWEYGSPIVEKYGRLVNLDIAPGYTAVAPVLGMSPTGSLTGTKYPDSLVNPDKHEFQPRLAFSWHPLFGSTVVVRGGFGVYYNTSVYQTIANQMAQQSPLSKSLSVANNPADLFTMANPWVQQPGVTPNTFAIDPNFRVGYAQTWQLSVQRDLTEGIVMTATYLGIKGTRGIQVSYPQTYPLGVTGPCPSCPSGYAYMSSNGNSTNEAGTLALVRRFHNGLSANLTYKFAKAIDNAAMAGRGQGGSMVAQNWLDFSAERARSNLDQRHVVTFQTQYTTGVGVRGGALMSGWRGTAFKGWTFLTRISAGTGFPETPVYPGAVGRTGSTGSVRADYTGQDIYAAAPGYYLNAAAFAVPVGHWGNAGRNIITGPSQFSMDSSMARTFKDNFDVRFDATNTLNHVTFPMWNNVITNQKLFGLPTNPSAMRILQVTMRMRF